MALFGLFKKRKPQKKEHGSARKAQTASSSQAAPQSFPQPNGHSHHSNRAPQSSSQAKSRDVAAVQQENLPKPRQRVTSKRRSISHRLSRIHLGGTGSSSSVNGGSAPESISSSTSSVPAPQPLSDSYGRPRNFSSASGSMAPHRTASSSLRSILQTATANAAAATDGTNGTSGTNGTAQGAGTLSQDSASAVPSELIPIVTLIHAQAARCYFEATAKVPVSATETYITTDSRITWASASVKLVGTDLAVWPQNGEADSPLMVNVVDAEYSWRVPQPGVYELKIRITQDASYFLRVDTQEDLNYILAGCLLSQYEYKQLQEGFTGALLSSKAIHFPDIRTVLDPKNIHPVSEWCIVRFPFVNDKWIRCYLIIKPSSKKGEAGKIEFYTSSSTSKRSLLATAIYGRTCSSIYPEAPEYIDNNALTRTWADCYINKDLLDEVISENPANADDVVKPRSHSLSKKLSSTSLSSKRRSRSNSRVQHRRMDSTNSQISQASSNDKRLSKLKNLELLNTNLCYIIPETHGSVPPCETMIRLLIPMMNTFQLYGRPEKFISSRDDRDSLLFGFPQLPHTQYLDMQSAYDLVCLNAQNAQREDWNSYEWSEVFKELVYVKISKGWNGTGSLVDIYKDSLVYDRDQLDPHGDSQYDPNEDFGSSSDRPSSRPTSLGSPVTPVAMSSRDNSRSSVLTDTTATH